MTQRLKTPLPLIFFLFCIAVGPAPVPAAGTDRQPATWRDLPGATSDLYAAAEKILQLFGYEMEKADPAAGILQTALSPMRLNLEECDCGLGGGAPVKDERPILYVSVAIAVAHGRISIRATIDGEYPKELVSPTMIEDDLFVRIEQYLK